MREAGRLRRISIYSATKGALDNITISLQRAGGAKDPRKQPAFRKDRDGRLSSGRCSRRRLARRLSRACHWAGLISQMTSALSRFSSLPTMRIGSPDSVSSPAAEPLGNECGPNAFGTFDVSARGSSEASGILAPPKDWNSSMTSAEVSPVDREEFYRALKKNDLAKL